MQAAQAAFSFVANKLPTQVRERAGLSPQISDDVKHILWLSVERAFWPSPNSSRLFLVVGYTDGFQIWDLEDAQAPQEVLSKQDKAVSLVRLLPVPQTLGDEPPADGSKAQGLANAPMVAYLTGRDAGNKVVRLYSAKKHDTIHFLRLEEPAKLLQATRRFFAVGTTKQVDVYDALTFEWSFKVNCNAPPAFALGPRWLAYNLPPQPAGGQGGAERLLAGGARQLPNVMKEGLQYLGQVGQRTLDSVLMPQAAGDQAESGAGNERCGIVAIVDCRSQMAVAQFEDHMEPIEMMTWDPSGLQLVTSVANGHKLMVYRALLSADKALLTQDDSDDSGGLALGSIVFQHLYTLQRGTTPAIISDISVSDDGRLVAVSSSKGTTHVFRLPPLHTVAVGHKQFPQETGAVRIQAALPTTTSASGVAVGVSLGYTGAPGAPAPKAMVIQTSTKVKLGQLMMEEALRPKCGFQSVSSAAGGGHGSSSASTRSHPEVHMRLQIASFVGSVSQFSLSPAPPATSATSSARPGPNATGVGGGCLHESETIELQHKLVRETPICRTLTHFTERRLELAGQQAGQPGGSLLPSPRGARSPRGVSSMAAESQDLQRQTSSDADAHVWLSQAETATHAPLDVPLWLCPLLSFHTFAETLPRHEINSTLRAGCEVPRRTKLCIKRPERLAEAVRYDGVSAPGEERLSELFGGAIQAAVHASSSRTATTPYGRDRCGSLSHGSVLAGATSAGGPPDKPRGSVSLVPAWGTIDGVASHISEAEPEVELLGPPIDSIDDDWIKEGFD
eukprot:TRINITY_DN20479_c0_g1_i1.p1 TRINITY_DN20479_c0_g1~~TRINITY_DN20479_c0_g1_i1.p1  ORF type:complete len:789 (-),score=122.29 TRINITY_DN20479_c0_g1_i1:709-3075(-)